MIYQAHRGCCVHRGRSEDGHVTAAACVTGNPCEAFRLAQAGKDTRKRLVWVAKTVAEGRRVAVRSFVWSVVTTFVTSLVFQQYFLPGALLDLPL